MYTLRPFHARPVWSQVALFVLVALVNNAAFAQIGVSGGMTIQQSGPLTCKNIALSKEVPCPDSAMFFHEGRALVQRAFLDRNYEELDRLYSQWCRGVDRFPDGRWKLSQYGDGLADIFDTWNTWPRFLEYIKAWQAARPDSSAANYAEAVYWRTYAWRARGTGYAKSVSGEGWELFNERLSKANATLAKLQKAMTQCPAPIPVAINILTDLGSSEEKLRAVYSKGVRRFPEYHGIYFAMARHYQPSWGGSIQQYEDFANEVAHATKKFEGMGMYARIYWLVDNKYGIPFSEQSSQPPYWEKLRAGYDDLIRKYPSSIHNLGKYAGVACRTNDGSLYRALRSKIDGYEDSADMNDPVDVCDKRHSWQPAADSRR